MQLQKKLNAFKIFNKKVNQINQLTRVAIEKSRSFVLFNTSRNKNILTNNANLFTIYIINFIIVSNFINNNKKFNKLLFSNKFTDKKNKNLKFLD